MFILPGMLVFRSDNVISPAIAISFAAALDISVAYPKIPLNV